MIWLWVKPTPFWGRCITHFRLFWWGLGCSLGIRDFDPWPYEQCGLEQLMPGWLELSTPGSSAHHYLTVGSMLIAMFVQPHRDATLWTPFEEPPITLRHRCHTGCFAHCSRPQHSVGSTLICRILCFKGFTSNALCPTAGL